MSRDYQLTERGELAGRLVLRYRAGEIELAKEIHEISHGYVIGAARRRYRQAHTLYDCDDLIQEGHLGVAEAMTKYTGERAWGTYVLWYILKYVKRYIAENSGPARVHSALYYEIVGEDSGRRSVSHRDRLCHDRGRAVLRSRHVGRAQYTMGKIAPAVDAAAIDDRDWLAKQMRHLTTTEREVLTRIYALDGGNEEEELEIAARKGVSRQAISQSHVRAIRKLRDIVATRRAS